MNLDLTITPEGAEALQNFSKVANRYEKKRKTRKLFSLVLFGSLFFCAGLLVGVFI